MNVGSSALKLLASRSASSFLFFLGITLFARRLPPDEFGVFFLYLATVGVMTILADFGTCGALEKRLSEGGPRADILGSALAFKAGLLAVLVGGILLAGPVINAYAGTDIALFLAVGLPATEFARFYVHAVRGELRVGLTAPIQFARRVIWIGVGFVLVRAGYGVDGIIVGLICGRFVEGLLAFWQSDTSAGSPSVEAVRSLFSFSKYQTVLSVGGRFYQWMDTLIIGFFLPNLFVSSYELAWQVTLLVLLVSKSLELTLFPAISSLHADAKLERIRATVTKAFGYAMVVSIPAIVGAALYAEEILRFVFGPAYAFAGVVLVVLMVEKAFQSFNDVTIAALRGIDSPELPAKATVLSIAVNLVLSPLLILNVGFVGVAIGTTTAWLMNGLLQFRYLRRHVDVVFPARLFGWYWVGALLMGVALLALETNFPVTGLASLIVHVGVGTLVYFSALSFVPRVRRDILGPGLHAIVPAATTPSSSNRE